MKTKKLDPYLNITFPISEESLKRNHADLVGYELIPEIGDETVPIETITKNWKNSDPDWKRTGK